MDDIRHWDRQLFWQCLLRPGWIFMILTAMALGYAVGASTSFASSFLSMVIGFVGMSAIGAASAWEDSKSRRFRHARHRALWETCQERLTRFHKEVIALRKSRIAGFEELPKSIEAVAQSLYAALRRADRVLGEISKSEGWLQGQTPPTAMVPSNDPQAQELYRIADKNIAEYRQHYSAVMAGVQRTEAQAAVFATTLDTLRLRMLGHRLAGRRPEMSSEDFLIAMTEAKRQLESIDRALEEIELGPFPKMVAVVPADMRLGGPPPIPDDSAQQQIRLGRDDS